MKRCSFCNKESENLIEIHDQPVCDWKCGLGLKNVLDGLLTKWQEDKFGYVLCHTCGERVKENIEDHNKKHGNKRILFNEL